MRRVRAKIEAAKPPSSHQAKSHEELGRCSGWTGIDLAASRTARPGQSALRYTRRMSEARESVDVRRQAPGSALSSTAHRQPETFQQPPVHGSLSPPTFALDSLDPRERHTVAPKGLADQLGRGRT